MNLALSKREHNEVKLLEVRSLTPADLDLLRQKTTAKFPVKTLKDRHHHMAFLVALGKSNYEIAAECRCSPSRVAQHKAAPAFQDLVAKYRKELEAARIAALQDFGAASTRNMELAEGLLTRELEAAVEGTAQTPSLPVLNRIATDRMDRFGYPKKTLTDSRNINLNFAANLEAAIARSRRSS